MNDFERVGSVDRGITIRGHTSDFIRRTVYTSNITTFVQCSGDDKRCVGVKSICEGRVFDRVKTDVLTAGLLNVDDGADGDLFR